MVNWQSGDADTRLLAAIFASDAGIRPDTEIVANLFGRGASTSSINHQFQRIRKCAKELLDEARKNGVQTSRGGPRTPRTPRTPRVVSNGINKSRSLTKSSGKAKDIGTPTKANKKGATVQGNSVVDTIMVDSNDDTDGDESLVKSETMSVDDNLKKETKQEDMVDDNEDRLSKQDADTHIPEATEMFTQGPLQFRVDSQTNGYVDDASAKTTSNGEDNRTAFLYNMYSDYA